LADIHGNRAAQNTAVYTSNIVLRNSMYDIRYSYE